MIRLKIIQDPFRVFILVLLILGVFFRWVNIDRKVYWHDEVYTSLRVSGYNGDRVIEQVFQGQIITPEDLLQYQRLSPEKDWKDTMNALVEHPEHPPLYYILSRLWQELFGSSVAIARSLSVFISLLVFPSLYWLCWELFRSPGVGWMAIALLTVSPFHVLYAQEARQYTLWTVMILLSSASLLRAIRLQKESINPLNRFQNWGIYAVTLALSFYTFLFSAFVAIAHGIYVIAIARFRWNKTIGDYLLSSAIALLLLAPWLWIIVENYYNFKEKTSWTNERQPLSFLATLWGLHISSIFVDFGFELYSPLTYLTILLILILVGYSLYWVYCQTSKEVWWFLLTLIGVTAVGLIFPDLMWGGRRSSMSRYFIPCYLGIQPAVAYLLATKMLKGKFLQRKIWQSIAVILISGGVISCAITSQSDTWWNKIASYHNAEVARIFNESDRPLIVSDNSGINVGNLISLSHRLNPNVRLLLVVEPNVPKIPDGVGDVFLFNPSNSLFSGIQKEHDLELVPDKGYPIWKLKKP